MSAKIKEKSEMSKQSANFFNSKGTKGSGTFVPF